MKSYRIDVFGWGNELAAGDMPDEMAAYINGSCQGDVNEYREQLENGDVPAEAVAFDDFWSSFDFAEWHEYGAGPTATLTVTDITDGNETEVYREELSKTPEYVREETPFHKTHDKYWVTESDEKGLWYTAEFDSDNEFDPARLTVFAKSLAVDGGSSAFDILARIEYEGEDLNGEFESSDGKGSDMRVYEER